jgi:hypothetical protein
MRSVACDLDLFKLSLWPRRHDPGGAGVADKKQYRQRELQSKRRQDCSKGQESVRMAMISLTARPPITIRTIACTRILLDQGVYVSMMVFAVGFRHLTRQARQDYEWLGTLLFGAAVVWLAVTLVADGLAGGAVLDSISSQPDVSAVRALTMGTILIYNSSTAFVMTAMFLAVAGFATLGTRVLPAWTGWLALVGAGLCLACVPAMYGGPVNFVGLYNAGSLGPALVANFPPAIWFAAVSLVTLCKQGASVGRIG